MNVETIEIRTSDGIALAADVAHPDAEATGAVVICHPHPLYGGNRHNQVVEALFRTLPLHRTITVRFDFRGAGDSQGTHGAGVGELLDVEAAIDAAAVHVLPIVLIGYSFGGLMALRVADIKISAWVAIAAPLGKDASEEDAVGHDQRHKLLLVPEHDQFATPDAIRDRTQHWRNAAVLPIPMADHFLSGRTSVVAGQVAAFTNLVTGGQLPST